MEKKRVNCYLPQKLIDMLDEEASSLSFSRSTMMVSIINQYFGARNAMGQLEQLRELMGDIKGIVEDGQ